MPITPKMWARIIFTGRVEHERFSMFENAVEGVGVYGVIVLLVYRLIFQGTSILEDVLRTCTLFYVIVLGPIIHRNSPEALGIGNIRLLKDQVFNRRHGVTIITVVFLGGLSVLVFPMFLYNFEAVLRLVPLVGQFNALIAGEAPGFRLPLAIIEYVLFQLLLIFAIVRKDNLWRAIKSMAKPTMYILAGIFIWSLVSFELFRIDDSILDFFAIWYGYTLWGMMQQIPFLVYFSTRYRKGFPYSRVSDFANVALISSFFGFFHAPQWPLVILAFLMEIVLARSYLHDRTRNLFVAGAFHGFVGTVIIFFTGLYIKMDFV